MSQKILRCLRISRRFWLAPHKITLMASPSVTGTIGAITIVVLILLAAYCWIVGLVRAVYWYRRTRKEIKPGSSVRSDLHWFDRYLFGYFAILSNPDALTAEGLAARRRTLSALQLLGFGALLVILVVLVDAHFGISGR